MRKIAHEVVRKRSTGSKVLGVVYRIGCADCDWNYVGESSRTLEERLKEHRVAVRELRDTSEIAQHVGTTGHRVDWEGAKILDRETNYTKRGIKEAWWTVSQNSGNRTRWTLDGTWKRLAGGV